MLLVGLTGGLASGKSTVARSLAARGAVVVDADALARRVVEPGTPGLARVVEEFGTEVLAGDGSLDRAALAGLVFDEPERRKALEAIIHPEVFRLLGDEVERYRGTDTVLVFDAPLIVETGFDRACDVLVVVSAPAEEQVERVVAAGKMSADEAQARIAAQVDPAQRRARADIIVDNSGSLEDLEDEVEVLWRDLRARA